MSNRKELIEKFERNLNLMREFKILYNFFLDKTNTWDKEAFPDSNITNGQYLEILNQVSEKEYSNEQHEAIKNVFIHEDAINDYITNLEIQYKNLKSLFDEIAIKNENFNK
ncbi:hypothetical protein IRZ71_03900 [Flavobacterium sp. ANB]|uniref:hypothetical protein n=1 Tax=unclassified Flavobacterium TaxID=196869 RepID=UPI0012B9ED48|nr:MULTISPECIES: hypothetical protein [unclassified Flavobacterium]MBF4515467.1 hypothetical protein [Flavobacterium sp. ANB]MTD68470.1 hypothetical protein [Flavobacterium sp. LC2016-13]